MYRRLFILFCLTSISMSVAADLAQQPRILSNLQQYSPMPLAKGFQGPLDKNMIEIDSGQGAAPSLYFQLPQYDSPHELRLISKVTQDNGVFYPVVLLLSADFHILKEVRPAVALIRAGYPNPTIQANIPVEPDYKYLLITTDPTLLGKLLSYSQESTGIMPIYNGNNVTYLPTTTGSSMVDVFIATTPDLELFVPHDENRQPFIRQQGVFLELGATQGGEKIADNPDGDDYNAGGGALGGIGYSHTLFNQRYWMGRYSFDARYQGGKGRNEGWIAQASVVYTQPKFNIGAGIYYDFDNKVNDIQGNRTELDPALGTSLLAEWRASDRFNFGIRYLFIDYKSKGGESLDGNQGALYLMWWL